MAAAAVTAATPAAVNMAAAAVTAATPAAATATPANTAAQADTAVPWTDTAVAPEATRKSDAPVQHARECGEKGEDGLPRGEHVPGVAEL